MTQFLLIPTTDPSSNFMSRQKPYSTVIQSPAQPFMEQCNNGYGPGNLIGMGNRSYNRESDDSSSYEDDATCIAITINL